MPWPMFERAWRQELAFHDMMVRRGVLPIETVRRCQGAAYEQGRTNCLRCVHDQACRRWLDGDTTVADPAGYCANQALFMSCGSGEKPGG